MEQEKLKKYIKSKKTKIITLKEIYETLKLPYTPQNDKKIHNIINELIQNKNIEPLKTTKQDKQGNYEKYRILNTNKENETKIKEEILKLDAKLEIGFFLKNPEEYIKNKEIIIPINEYIKNNLNKKTILTVNEKSYQIYQNEKKLKENEEIHDLQTIDDITRKRVIHNFKFYFQNILAMLKNRETITLKQLAKFIEQNYGSKSLYNGDFISFVIYLNNKKQIKENEEEIFSEFHFQPLKIISSNNDIDLGNGLKITDITIRRVTWNN